MSESTDNRAVNEPEEDQTTSNEDDRANDATARRSRRGLRFGLLELLLLTAVVAAWLPVIIAHRQIPGLETEIQTMRLATADLIVMDDEQLTARTLPSIWHNISSWKYSLPSGADMELRLATEGINSIAPPADYQAVTLPEGEHTIHLKVTSNTEGYQTDVYVDDELVLRQRHGPDWLDSHGSSSTGDVSDRSTAYPLDQPLRLKVQRYSIKHPLQKYQSVDTPNEYDLKGNYLWISPRSILPKPPSDFLVPRNKYSRDGIGHRQGLKVCLSNQMGLAGLICIQPSLDSTLGDQRLGNYRPLGISVRPVLDDQSAPEISEQQTNANMPKNPGTSILLQDTITPHAKSGGVALQELVTTKAISSDGKSMRLFAHFSPFPSGAKPIVEILFDAAHPDRVGFLPHAATDSAPMVACQLETQFDARFFWREIEMLPDAERDSNAASPKTSPVPLSLLYPQIAFEKITKSSTPDIAPLSWRNIPLARLPLIKQTDTAAAMFRLSLLTDVADSSKLKFPLGLSSQWQYEGVSNRQVWWVPAASANDVSESGITVDVRATPVFPTTTIPLPGGPAIGNVRITVPMPATQPVWLEVVADPTVSSILGGPTE